MSAPREVDWEPGEPIPHGYVQRTKPRLGLVIGGAVMLGATWIATASIAALFAPSESRVAPLFVPAVGPFIGIGTIGTRDLRGVGTFLLVLDGVTQTAGAIMLIAGLAAPKSVLVRMQSATLRPAPMTFGKDGHGFGLAGTF